jgi:hypothetical protein
MPTQISLATLKLHNERLDELVNELEAYFAFRTPTPKDRFEDIMYKAGQASVIEYIKHKLEDE